MIWGLWISVYMINNGLVTWLPTLYRQVFQLPLQTSLAYGWITSGVGVAASIMCALLIDKVGRKAWYGTAFLVATLPLLALSWLGATSAIEVLDSRDISLCHSADHRVLALSLLIGAVPDLPARDRHRLRQCWLRAGSSIGSISVGWITADLGICYVFAGFAAVASSVGSWCWSSRSRPKAGSWRSCRPERSSAKARLKTEPRPIIRRGVAASRRRKLRRMVSSEPKPQRCEIRFTGRRVPDSSRRAASTRSRSDRMNRSQSGGLHITPAECALAHAGPGGQRRQRPDRRRDAGRSSQRRTPNLSSAVRSDSAVLNCACPPGRLRNMTEVTRHRQRHRAPQILLHQRQREIDARRDAGRGPNRTVAHENRIDLDTHRGETPREVRAIGPMGGCTAAVQHTGGSQQKRAGADGGDAARLLARARSQAINTGSAIAASTPGPPAIISVSTATLIRGSGRAESPMPAEAVTPSPPLAHHPQDIRRCASGRGDVLVGGGEHLQRPGDIEQLHRPDRPALRRHAPHRAGTGVAENEGSLAYPP